MRCMLLEITDRIAFDAHDVADELVGFDDRGRGTLDEMPLDPNPFDAVVLALGCIELTDVERLHFLRAADQLALRTCTVSGRRHDMVVLASEFVAQLLRARAPRAAREQADDGQQRNRADCNPYPSRVQGHKSLRGGGLQVAGR